MKILEMGGIAPNDLDGHYISSHIFLWETEDCRHTCRQIVKVI